MSNLIKKVVTGVSSLALAASMLVAPFIAPTTALAASAGEVYKSTDGTVWFITSDMKKRPFTSAGAFLSYGFLSFSQVKDADASVTALSTGDFIAPQDGRIFCATETKASDVKGECSLITGGKKAAFTSSAVFTGQGYSFARAYYGDSSFLEKTSNVDNASAQHRPGTLVNNGGTIQMVVTGGLWGTPSMDVFNSWGWNIADVVPANSADKLLTQTGVIPARQAGQLVPTATSTPNPTANCNDLDGTTGSITANDLSDYSAEEVGEGEDEVPVMAFEIEADNDSDVAITSMKVELDAPGTGSDHLDDYMSEVSIWQGDTKVGSADVEDFTETAVNGTYTKTISLDCAAVAADETEMFTVAVSAINNIDSGDLNHNFNVDVLSVRFEDGDGVTTTEDTDADGLDKVFTFQSFATATDVELKSSLTETDEAHAINDAHVIDIDDTDDTKDVEVLAFTLENKGDSDVELIDLPVLVTTTGETDEAALLLKASLWMDGDKIGSESMVTGGAITFDDLNIGIDAGDTADFTVTVDIQDTAGAADNGDTVQAQVTVASIVAEDEEGDDLQAGDLTGTAVGQTSTVYDAGIMTSFVDADATRTLIADAAGEFDQGTFNITFEVTAFDGDFRIDKSCEEGATTATGAYTLADSTSILATEIFRAIINGTTVAYTATVGDVAGGDAADTLAVMTGLAAAIDADATVGPLVNASVSDAAGTTTINLVATTAGTAGNYTTTATDTSTAATLVASQVAMTGGASTDAAGQGVSYLISNPGNNSTTCVVTSSSTDTEDTSFTFKVDEDTTREFTLTVNATSSVDAFAEVSLASINWGTATNDTNASYYSFDLGEYKTKSIFLNTF